MFCKFLFVGGVGLLIDTALTVWMVAGGVHPVLSKGLAFSAAVVATFILNSKLTFQAAMSVQVLARYLIAQGSMAIVASIVFYVVLLIIPQGLLSVLLASVVVSGGVAVANYVLMKRFVFKVD